MIKVYVKSERLEDGNNETIDVTAQTVAAAKRGKVTDVLRRAVRAALGEEIMLIN